jgi:GST-like protein
VLDRRLAGNEYVAGDYAIADIAIWPWISRFAWQTVNFDDYQHVKRWYLAIAERPAVRRGWNVPPRDGGIPMPQSMRRE